MKLSFIKKALIGGLLTVIALIGTLVGTLPAFAAAPSPTDPPTVKIDAPDTVTAGVAFYVTINLGSSAALRGWQTELNFPAAKLVSQSYTSGQWPADLQESDPSFFWTDDVTYAPDTLAYTHSSAVTRDNTNGKVSGLYGALTGAPGHGQTGSGDLVILKFITASGVNNTTANLTLSTTGNNATMLVGTAVDGVGNALPYAGGWTILTKTINIGDPNLNSAPIADPQTVTTAEDVKSSTIVLTANDTDGDPLTYKISTLPTNGTVYDGATAIATVPHTLTGALTYLGNANWNGTDHFGFKANDGVKGDSGEAIVTVNVSPVNDLPVAYPVSASGNEDTAIPVTFNATDVDGDSLTYGIVSGPSHGTLDPVSGNTVTYHPAANYHGSDTFNYHAYDGHGYSSAALATITIVSVNDAPVASDLGPTDGLVKVSKNVAKTFTLPASDVDGDSLTYSIVTPPSSTAGIAALVGSGPNVTFTPAADYTGDAQFTFKANDGHLDSNTATVYISVVSGAVDVNGTKGAYLTFTAPSGAVNWTFAASSAGDYTNGSMGMSVDANTGWRAQVMTAPGTGDGRMTKYNTTLNTYDTNVHLGNPLHVVASGTHGSDIALSGAAQTLAVCTPADFVSTYYFAYGITFNQHVDYSDPGLPDPYAYHTVVQFTGVASY